MKTATIVLPSGYATAEEFAKDCGFELPAVPALGTPVAWQCIDERREFRYIKGIVSVDKETVEAWKDVGIAFVGLGRIDVPAQGQPASLPLCCVTGLIAGDKDACGDCDPCGAWLSVPEPVKELMRNRDEWANKYSEAMGELDEQRQAGVPAEGATDRGQFASLRAANEVRQREWDVLGQLTLAYRGNELAGEVGEACNVIKKLERERLGINGSRDTVEHLAEELADVIICTDLIAMQAGIDLEGAVVAKFNASSEKVGLKTRMVRRQSPAASASELPAWEDPRVQTVYNMLCDPALDTPPNPEEHWEGWVSRNIVKALCPSQPETDAEVFMASNAALTSEVLQLRAQVERLTAALTEIEDLGVDGATGARLANIATQALSPLPFEPKKERKPKLSPQNRQEAK